MKYLGMVARRFRVMARRVIIVARPMKAAPAKKILNCLRERCENIDESVSDCMSVFWGALSGGGGEGLAGGS